MASTITNTLLWASGAALAGVPGTMTWGLPGTAATDAEGYEDAGMRASSTAAFPLPFFARPPKGAEGPRAGGGAETAASLLRQIEIWEQANAFSHTSALKEEAVDGLITALEHSDMSVRTAAAKTLGRVGDVRAVPHLIQLFQESTFTILQAVYEAVESFGVRALPALTQALHDEHPKVRSMAAMMLGEIKDKKALAPLMDALEHARGEDIGHIGAALESFGDPAALPRLRDMLENELPTRTRKILMRAVDALTKREDGGTVETKAPAMAEIVEDIAAHLSEGLGLSRSVGVSVGDVPTYGSMTATGALALKPLPALAQRQDLMSPNVWLSVDRGGDAKARQEMMPALNFLVPHEIAHRLQDERGIARPVIEGSSFRSFDRDRVLASANETMIDKLALLIARNVYVAMHGDVLFSEDMREAIAIASAATLYKMALRRHRSGERHLSGEETARASAVLLEMGARDAVGMHAKRSLKGLADAFSAVAMAPFDARKRAAFRRLIEVYREIFRSTELDI